MDNDYQEKYERGYAFAKKYQVISRECIMAFVRKLDTVEHTLNSRLTPAWDKIHDSVYYIAYIIKESKVYIHSAI